MADGQRPLLWQILIASVYARTSMLDRLLYHVSGQITDSHARDRVEVVVDRDDCDRPVGEKRGRLLEHATGDYVCFVDDDDWVSWRYVDRIVAALERSRPDYVGFQVAYSVDGVPQKSAFHSLEFPEWGEDERGYYRGISHLNPMRRDAAMAGLPFLPGFGEDHDWARRVQTAGVVKTEVYVEGDALYWYRHSTTGSLFHGGPRRVGADPGLRSFPRVRMLP